jgi:hypothetical protein
MLRSYVRQNAEVCTRPKATDTTTEYVVLTAFPLQQWLHERYSVLRYRACLSGLWYQNFLICVVVKEEQKERGKEVRTKENGWKEGRRE